VGGGLEVSLQSQYQLGAPRLQLQNRGVQMGRIETLLPTPIVYLAETSLSLFSPPREALNFFRELFSFLDSFLNPSVKTGHGVNTSCSPLYDRR